MSIFTSIAIQVCQVRPGEGVRRGAVWRYAVMQKIGQDLLRLNRNA